MAKNEHEQETEHEVFEFAGKKLLKSGTSGPHKLPTQVAQGTPVRHDLTVAGRSMMSAGTSGPHSLPIRRPTGLPVQVNIGQQQAATASSPRVSTFGLAEGPKRIS